MMNVSIAARAAVAGVVFRFRLIMLDISLLLFPFKIFPNLSFGIVAQLRFVLTKQDVFLNLGYENSLGNLSIVCTFGNVSCMLALRVN